MATAGMQREGASYFLLAPLQPTRGGPLLLPGHSTVPVNVQQFTERTRTLLVECASLLTVQGTEGPPPDIDVTSALIPTMPQAIAAAVAEVDDTFNAADLIAKSSEGGRVKKTHATPTGVPAGLKPSRAIGKGRRGHKKKAPRKEKGKAVDLDTPWSLERRDYYRDGAFASAAASAAAAGDDDDAAQTVGSAFGERGGGQASTSDADGGVIMTLDDLLSSTRTDVIDRLRPHEPWVVARTGAAAAARADLEARRQRGDEQLHFLRALTGWKKKDRACRELSQATVCNYVSRPMQTLLYQKRLMAALDSVHELRVHDDGHWREVFAQEEAAAAQAQGVTTVATDEEVLLRVEVYHAAKPQLRMQEFMVLGSQRVSELMDRVYCLLDVDVAQPHGVRRHSQPPPRFVYLDGVFYSEVCGDGSAAAPIIRHAALLRREGAAAAEKTEAKEAGKQVALTASQAREAAIVAAASQNQRGVTGLGPSDEGEDALGGDAPGATPTPLTQPSSAETAVEAAAAGSATHTAPQGAVPLPVHPAAAIVGTPSFREQHTGRSNQTRTKLPRGWRPEEALFTADAVRGEAPLDGLLFSQLTTAVGAHAVFCHHGCCEHKLVVKDVRLPHPADVRNRALYPLLVMHGKKPERKCQVCDTFSAKVATRGGRLAMHSPAFYCDQCFALAHDATTQQPPGAAPQPPTDPNTVAAPPTFTAASGLRTLESFPYYHD